jgi:hypothetical protein
MDFKEFCREHKRIWSSYLRSVSNDVARGTVTLGSGRLLFPNIVLYTETEDHYIAELFGCDLRFNELSDRTNKEDSTVKYFYQFTDNSENPVFMVDGSMGLINLLLSRDVDIGKVKERFGFDPGEVFPTRLVMQKEGGSLLSFGPNFQYCFLNNCAIVNSFKQFYRMKTILYACIISKTSTLDSFAAKLRDECVWPVENSDKLRGINYVPNELVESYKLSGQFANMYLVPDIREPNIGKFLHRNQRILLKALECTDLKYEHPFKWIEGNKNQSEDCIQPDFMLKSSATNYWDICDIKKPLLGKESLTKGEHRRRRFIDEVGEGIAQLANYEEYFTYPGNSDYARNKYEVEVNSPKLILVVGNYENTDIDEVREASRSIRENYIIVDYDTLNAAYLGAIHKLK